MEQFYVIVMTTVVVLLILTLTYIGVYVVNDDDKNTTFPPVETQCPDYWGTKDGKCIVPDTMNKGTLSSASGTEMDFTGASYDTICKKKQWANDNGISWDGISNYNKC